MTTGNVASTPVGNVLERLQCETGPDPGVRRNRRRKADSIQAVVDTHPHATPVLNCLPQEVTQQGKRQETVRDRGAVGVNPAVPVRDRHESTPGPPWFPQTAEFGPG
jgi:hypothetical protein